MYVFCRFSVSKNQELYCQLFPINQGVTESNVLKAVQTMSKVKLSENKVEDDGDRKSGKRVNICDTSGDIMIIPQATLGGKLKGNSVQYHNNVKPDEGEQFYKIFCDGLKECCGGKVSQNKFKMSLLLFASISRLLLILIYKLMIKCLYSIILNCLQVMCGVWGARQVINMDTNGPFSHVFDV